MDNKDLESPDLLVSADNSVNYNNIEDSNCINVVKTRRGQRSNKVASPDHPNIESYLPEITRIIKNNLFRWKLAARPDISTEDVFQRIIIHIVKKWPLYDPAKPIQNWVNTITINQINNLLRDEYYKFARPCLGCEHEESTPEFENGCKLYGTQCDACPLFKQWKKTKESSFNINLPLSLAHHENEVNTKIGDDSDLTEYFDQLTIKMEEVLTINEFQVYKNLFIEGLSEIETAKKMGYKVQKGELSVQRQISNIKILIIEKVKCLLKSGSLFED